MFSWLYVLEAKICFSTSLLSQKESNTGSDQLIFFQKDYDMFSLNDCFLLGLHKFIQKEKKEREIALYPSQRLFVLLNENMNFLNIRSIGGGN